MKYTEGAFRKWGYQVARERFADDTITEAELFRKTRRETARGKSRCQGADRGHAVSAGAAAAGSIQRDRHPQSQRRLHFGCARGPGRRLGMAPGANIGDECERSVFEGIHGTAPKYAGLDKVNPSSLILSGAMLLDYIGWQEAAENMKQLCRKPSRPVSSPTIWPVRSTVRGRSGARCRGNRRAHGALTPQIPLPGTGQRQNRHPTG